MAAFALFFFPCHVDPALGCSAIILEHFAIDRMDRHAFSGMHNPDDFIARKRVAAAAEVDEPLVTIPIDARIKATVNANRDIGRTPQLMKLRKPQPLRMFNHHDGRIRNINSYLDNRSGDQNIDLMVSKIF